MGISSIKKRIIVILLILNMLVTTGMSFAYWASSLTGNQNTGNGSLTLGDWYDGIPIFTVDEFIEVITTPNNANAYVLARDLDFQNVTPPAWVQTKDIIFQGSLDGNGKTLSNISLTNYRGVFGILQGATIRNLTLNNVNINYTLTDNYTVGILAGRMQGTGNVIENIRVLNSSVTNTIVAGGIIGFASPTSGTGTATMSNIKVKNTSITGAFANNQYGNGGIIGTVSNFNITMSDLYVEATITSNAVSSVGGIIGASLTGSTLSIDRAVVFSNERFRAWSNDASVFVAGVIGRNQGSISISNFMLTGQLDGYVTNPSNTNWTMRAGVTVGVGNAPTSQSNVRSSQITLYRRASNPAVAVANATNYNKMTGIKPAHSSTVYINSRSTTMTNAWWTTNYSTIANSSLWTYNATTNLYELNN